MMAKFRALSIVAILFSLSSHKPAEAGTNYNLNPLSIDNTDGATLDGGFFATDGTTGTGLTLGIILLDYEVTISEGLTTVTLTPSNSEILFDTFSSFDVSPSAITVNTLPTDPPPFPNFDFIISGVPSGSGFYRVTSSRRGEDVFVSVDALGGGSRSTATGLPRTIATVVPEPTSLVICLSGFSGIGFVTGRSRFSRQLA